MVGAPSVVNPGAAAAEPRRFYGKYRGQVIDNEDPEGRARLQVEVAALPGIHLNWALPCLPWAGPQVGFFCVPPRRAMVWVEFEEGDPSRPIWTGCFWDVGQQLPDLIEEPIAAPFKKILRTACLELVLDDTPEAGGFSLTVRDPAVPVPISITGNAAGITATVEPATVKVAPEVISASLPPTSLRMTEEAALLTVAEATVSVTEAAITSTVDPAVLMVAPEAISASVEPSNVAITAEAVEIEAAESTVTVSPEAIVLNSAEAIGTLSAEVISLELGASNVTLAPVGLVLNDGALEVI